jgi:transcriptional regulator with XRE-family HTH domain
MFRAGGLAYDEVKSSERSEDMLAYLRRKAGLTQEEVALKVGTSPAHLSRVENHELGLSDDMAARIGAVYGVDSHTLKCTHVCDGLKTAFKDLDGLPDEALRAVMVKQSRRFVNVLQGLRDLLTDDEVPQDVQRVAAKTLARLVKTAETVVHVDDRTDGPGPEQRQERDIFGRRRW